MVSRPVVSARPVGDYSAGSPKVCTVDGCDRTDHQARDLCNKHYEQWRTSTPERRMAKRRSTTASKRRARGVKHDLGRCEECRGVFAVIPSGSFRVPHLDEAGGRCRGCDLPVSVIVAVA